MSDLQERLRERANTHLALPPESTDLQTRLLERARQKEQLSAAANPQTDNSIGRQVGLTARGAIEGVAALGGLVSDPVAASVNMFLPEEDELLPLKTAVSQLLTRAGVPEPENRTERIVQEVVQSVSAGGGTVKVAREAAERVGPLATKVLEKVAAQPGAQAGGDALSGAAAQGAREADLGTGAEIAAALLGGSAGSSAVTRAPRGVSDVDLPTDQGVRVMTSDAAPPKTFVGKTARAMGERIPLAGTGDVRAKQQDERVEAVKSVLLDFGAEEASAFGEAIMSDLSKTRLTALARQTKIKDDILKRISNGGPVQTDRTVKEIDAQITKLKGLKAEGLGPVIRQLEDFKKSINGQSIENIEELRKLLGESFKSPELSSVRKVGESVTGPIYNALREDMGSHIMNIGGSTMFNQWRGANRRLSAMAGELKNTAFKSVLRTGEGTPEDVFKLLFSKKRSQVRQLYRNLSPEGQSHARAAILWRAAEKAGGIDNISPDRFANEVKRLGAQTGVFFTGADQKRVEGLVRVLDMTKRASEAAAAPPTGAQLAIPVTGMLLTDLFASSGAAMGAGASIGLMARAYESPPVRGLMVRLANTKRGSPEEAKIFKRIMDVWQTQAPIETDRQTPRQEQEPAPTE